MKKYALTDLLRQIRSLRYEIWQPTHQRCKTLHSLLCRSTSATSGDVAVISEMEMDSHCRYVWQKSCKINEQDIVVSIRLCRNNGRVSSFVFFTTHVWALARLVTVYNFIREMAEMET